MDLIFAAITASLTLQSVSGFPFIRTKGQKVTTPLQQQLQKIGGKFTFGTQFRDKT